MRSLLPQQIDEVLGLLGEGSVVALPTDTVYGLAARLDQPEGVRRLFGAKRRPDSLALPLLAADVPSIEALLGREDGGLERVAAACWPGALTLVISAPLPLAAQLGASDATIGVRIPDDGWLRILLRRSGALAVSSANRHGHPPCQSAGEVRAALDGNSLVAAVVDGGQRSAPASTVISIVSGEAVELRAGPVPLAKVAAALSAG